VTIDARPHGRFLAGEAGELAGVSGTTIGQWARRGLIRSSISDDEPRVYSVEDVAEAAVVRALLERGIRHADVHRLIARLGDYGRWPLSEAAWPPPPSRCRGWCCARTTATGSSPPAAGSVRRRRRRSATCGCA